MTRTKTNVSEHKPSSLKYEKYVHLVPKIKKQGLEQFVHNYKRMQNKGDYPFKWGDEVEQFIVRVDDENKTVRLALKGTEVLEKLVKLNQTLDAESSIDWKPEVGEFMAESSPGQPFGDTMDDLVKVESNMKLRRDQINNFLGEKEKMVTMTTYPLIGCKD